MSEENQTEVEEVVTAAAEGTEGSTGIEHETGHQTTKGEVEEEVEVGEEITARTEEAGETAREPEGPGEEGVNAPTSVVETKDGGAHGEEKGEEEKEINYNYDELKSGPEVVNISEDVYLELHHSFGYECQKRSNLVVLDKSTVAFSAGNMVEFLHLSSMNQHCLRSLGGGGIGALAVHPSRHYLAVGEKGTQPVIAIFTFPELGLHRILRGGTEEAYSHMDFSGEGDLLASVGGHPDFMLTVWEWKKESIVLRYKAFSQDVFRVSFSPENPGQLTTSGTGHIRFWKMASTFTGLKLQGQLGKFGRTELSDIAAYVELPDGKVLSGTEWGNLLLWDGGFIKVEISRKNMKFCHQGMIEALLLDDGELISAGVDGYIRVWDFETIDNADITDDNAVFEMDPLTEIRVGHDVSLKTLARSADPDAPTLWYAQDAAGAIWRVDITSSHTRQSPEKLASYHSGPVRGLDTCPSGHQAASIGHDGSVRVYDLGSKELLCHTQFSGGGASLIWAPTTVETPTTTILAGFRDGILRYAHIMLGCLSIIW
jgi:WD40 repeat protein